MMYDCQVMPLALDNLRRMNRKKTGRRSAGRPPAIAVAAVNAALLQAAAEVFAERGFAAASLAEIAERAKASRQTLYARFPNKTALFEALMQSRTAELLSSVSSLLNDSGDPAEVLQRFGERLVGQYIHSDLQRLHRMVIAEATTFPELAAFFFKNGPNRGKDLLMGYLREQAHQGSLVIADVEIAAEQFVGALVGAIIIRATLLQPQRLHQSEVEVWVRSAVQVFLCAHQSASNKKKSKPK